MAKTLNEQKHTDQRLRLLAQARRLFAAKGVKETSMSQVAKACRVTKATLYHYFKSKDAVLREIFQSHSDAKLGVVRVLKGAADLEECLYLMGKGMIEDMARRDQQELMRILLSETMKSAEMRKFYLHFITEQIGYIVQEVLVPMARCPKPEKEVRLLFFQFFASLMHYCWHQIMVGDISPLIGDKEAFVRTLARTYALRFKEA